VRIIVVTSSQDPADIERVKAFGISEYLTKPISERDLLRALGKKIPA
jgi:CheY-like chemotaxis protein